MSRLFAVSSVPMSLLTAKLFSARTFCVRTHPHDIILWRSFAAGKLFTFPSKRLFSKQYLFFRRTYPLCIGKRTREHCAETGARGYRFRKTRWCFRDASLFAQRKNITVWFVIVLYTCVCVRVCVQIYLLFFYPILNSAVMIICKQLVLCFFSRVYNMLLLRVCIIILRSDSSSINSWVYLKQKKTTTTTQRFLISRFIVYAYMIVVRTARLSSARYTRIPSKTFVVCD